MVHAVSISTAMDSVIEVQPLADDHVPVMQRRTVPSEDGRILKAKTIGSLADFGDKTGFFVGSTHSKAELHVALRAK